MQSGKSYLQGNVLNALLDVVFAMKQISLNVYNVMKDIIRKQVYVMYAQLNARLVLIKPHVNLVKMGIH